MTAVLRVGLVGLVGRGATASPTLLQALPAAFMQKCNISGRTMRGGPRVPKAAPYPYKTKNYTVFNSFFDKTSKRFDENSKVICVEGPIAAGKSKFGKELAEELDMQYFPAVDMDLIYINSYGYDMRKLDPELPPSCRSFDVRDFCKNPNHDHAALFQIQMYMLRYSQYIDALQHILSTGQGVVLQRSPYSDFVFMEAMFRQGYISKGARSVYNELRQNTIFELLKPHLVIYLDMPVNAVQQKIKERNLEHETNSKVFSEAYLRDLDMLYKQHYLKDIATHAELLIYDWTAGGETEVVVEDIERIDFAQHEVDAHNKKMADWRFMLETQWCEARIKYCKEKSDLMNYFNVPRFDVPELLRNADDSKVWRDVWYNAPGMKYRPGYNADVGDTGLLTKNKVGINEAI
ncbi:ND42 [Drosophila busckii]|uniref:NADH dehydrogenase [ubiquinone] 1 alpha subcomplex subunit 10, mitochondrial n=1 Tax=Drosophila busckii TaxID=30019 RepID=A0A0M4F600_DROBS|nr:NADH dehydrogenase [ubiquinone] 1 alpha subcomplex subunit 10, mitochondrial [Drosophila busckii]XP_017846696.1 NADH dehydrogenase [ubiquinone] 1 alpha subcomplex subunit 10, mitochondrial [Drosophila busckii]ALC47400.1 ND42 [Drosophila busckii]